MKYLKSERDALLIAATAGITTMAVILWMGGPGWAVSGFGMIAYWVIWARFSP